LALAGSVSHSGFGTVSVSDAGARLIRRHSCDQKKNAFDFTTGPPIV
jgi:hypothetical protein